jgi:hypothetical protein
VPLRLSAVYRAAVVFLTPDKPDAPAKEVLTVEATVNDSDVVTVTQP